MNIQSGDVLLVANREYPIRSCAEWASTHMNTLGFRRMASVSASTTRTQKGEPTPVLTGLTCTPLDPVDPDLKRRLALESPYELLQTFLTDGNGFVHLVLEDLKR